MTIETSLYLRKGDVVPERRASRSPRRAGVTMGNMTESRLELVRYDHGVRQGGRVTLCSSLEAAQEVAEQDGGEIVMRAIYATGWEDEI